jgi:hypothetical protein
MVSSNPKGGAVGLESVADGSTPPAPTVYSVLAHAAGAHSRRYLVTEALLAGTAVASVLFWQPSWWPAAFLALAVGLYASWGLLERVHDGDVSTSWPRVLRRIVAGVATAAALGGVAGLALKVFSGTEPGPYGMCYQPDGRSYACSVDERRRPME